MQDIGIGSYKWEGCGLVFFNMNSLPQCLGLLSLVVGK